MSTTRAASGEIRGRVLTMANRGPVAGAAVDAVIGPPLSVSWNFGQPLHDHERAQADPTTEGAPQ